MNEEQIRDISVKSVRDALNYNHPSKPRLSKEERMLISARNAIARTKMLLEGKLNPNTLDGYVTLEEDINRIFNKRNISIEEIKVVGDLYTIKTKRKGGIK